MLMAALLLSVALLLPISPTMSEGDSCFARIDYPAALEAYTGALRGNPGSPEALWRIARVYVCMAETAEGSVRDGLLARAEEHARLCVRADSLNPGGYTWLAASLGYRAYFAGGREQVELSWAILEATDRAIGLDSANDAAYSIRGSLYRALGNAGWFRRQLASLFFGALPEGGFAEGERALRRAIEIAPTVMRHHYELGVLYLDWGRTEDGLTALKTAEAQPVRVAIDRPRLEKIRTLTSRSAQE